MIRLFKTSSIILLAILALAPAALAEKKVKVIVKNGYKPVEGEYYVVKQPDSTTYTVTETTPASVEEYGGITITNPATEKTVRSVYVDGQLVGKTTDVKMIGAPEGTHTVEYRDADGNVLWTESSVRVTKHHTTVIYPQ